MERHRWKCKKIKIVDAQEAWKPQTGKGKKQNLGI